jgi:hypothetical protein
MTAPKKTQTAAAVAAGDQNVAVNDQSVAVEDQKVAENEQAAAVEVAPAEAAEALPEFIKLRAVYSLAVRHPDAVQPDGRPLIFTQHDAVQLPGYTISPTSPKRDQWIIDIIAAGYLERADV